jgi:hypothetical protein
MNEIPKEHQLECVTCGQILDMRDLGQILSHGQWNRENQRYECQEQPRDVEYTSSRKVGDSVEWTKDKTPINLN